VIKRAREESKLRELLSVSIARARDSVIFGAAAAEEGISAEKPSRSRA